MRVVVQSIEEFIETLESEVGNVYRDSIYTSNIKNDISEVKMSVIFQAATIIDLEDGSQYILETAKSCGSDYPGENEFEGSTEANRLKQTLLDYAESAGLKLRPGILDA